MKPKLLGRLAAAVVLLLSATTATASDLEIGGIYYALNDWDYSASVTYKGELPHMFDNEYSGVVIIPSEVTYAGKTYTVTSIGYGAFWNCSNLIAVDIPNSVTTIEDIAFSDCLGLISINIGNSVTNIGYCAFENCVSLTEVALPNSVTSIGSCAFQYCYSLTSVVIPNSVTSIGGFAFYGCVGLESIVVKSGNPVYDSRNNCNALIETYTNTLLWGCKNTIIPNSVTAIFDEAFAYCSLTSVEIPNSVTTIGKNAFEKCSGLKSISIGNSVTSIGDSAFCWCVSLTDLGIPNSVTSIGDWAFFDCESLTELEIPNSVTSIGDYAFTCCKGLESIIVKSGNPVYDSRDNCNALIEKSTNKLLQGCKNTIIPQTVTAIGNRAFEGSDLTAMEIPNSVTSIGDGAFRSCESLTELEIPNSVTSIGDEAFIYCIGLESINVESGNPVYDSRNNCNALIETSTNTLIWGCKNTIIPNSVTAIGDKAFVDCGDLTEIVIPNSITTIGNSAFHGCSNLMSVTSLNNNPPTIKNGGFGFSYVPLECVLYVPTNCKDKYKEAEGWSRFRDIRELTTGVEDVDAVDTTVRGENGVIHIEGAEGAQVEVFNAAGVCVFSGVATEIPVAQRGIYVVKVAGRATKLAL